MAESESTPGSLLKQTLMNVDECFVYKIPPLSTSGGHRAEQWDLANPLQTCGFQVERRDNDLFLLFTTDKHTKLFALSKLHEQDAARSIETVMDSSRYFVVKIQNNTGKSALIGFGFRKRDVAIDLLGNLQQFQKSIQREIQAKNLKVAEIPKLAEGEKIHINIGGSKKNGNKSKIVKGSNNHKGGGGPILLKKPPKAQFDLPKDHDETKEAARKAKPLTAEERKIRLSMGDIDLDKDHTSVSSEDSGNAHASKSVGIDSANIDLANDDLDDDEDDWDDFQSA